LGHIGGSCQTDSYEGSKIALLIC